MKFIIIQVTPVAATSWLIACPGIWPLLFIVYSGQTQVILDANGIAVRPEITKTLTGTDFTIISSKGGL